MTEDENSLDPHVGIQLHMALICDNEGFLIMELTYQLIRRNGDGTETMIAEAEGSNFWSEMYQFAVDYYDEESIYYTFGERGRKHVPRVAPTAEELATEERITVKVAEVTVWLDGLIADYIESYEVSQRVLAAEGEVSPEQITVTSQAKRKAVAAERVLKFIRNETKVNRIIGNVYDVFVSYTLELDEDTEIEAEVAHNAYFALQDV